MSNSLPLPDALGSLTRLNDWVRWGASRFNQAGLIFGHGSDNALDEAFHLVCHALHLPLELPAPYMDAHLTADECAAVHALLRQRIDTRQPAAYLTGTMWFAGLPFEVNPHVLVPRSPFAELISRHLAPWVTDAPARILDLCTGSGCIGIACALAFEDADVVLADLSDAALEVARRNVIKHDLGDRVRCVEGDLFTALRGEVFDLIVTNPPYVPTAEWQQLGAEYQQEPRMALDAGDDGMDCVARILLDAPAHLSEHGVLFCEVGGSQNEFEARWPDLPVTWAHFERGGDGIFVIDRASLAAYHTLHNEARHVR